MQWSGPGEAKSPNRLAVAGLDDEQSRPVIAVTWFRDVNSGSRFCRAWPNRNRCVHLPVESRFKGSKVIARRRG